MRKPGATQSLYPPLPGGNVAPVWGGEAFDVGGVSARVLHYLGQDSGWSKDLGEIREEITGEDHPIDLASRASSIEQIRKYCALPSPVILEVGCHAGHMLRDLAAAFPDAEVIGSDYLSAPLDTLGKETKGIPLLQFDLRKCPLPSNVIDVVVILNVLEHIDDDKAAVEQIFRILKPGGIAVIEVPAGPGLYDFYDEFWKHWRRYSVSGLSLLVRKAGFKVIYRGYMGTLIYPMFWGVKKLNRLRNGRDIEAKRAAIMRSNSSSGQSVILRAAMSIEGWFSGLLRKLPFGIRCVVTCRKA